MAWRRGSGLLGQIAPLAVSLPPAFAYANGVYDRTDREFLGFGTVITRDAVGREVEQTYDVSAYHRQGLLLETVVRGERTAVTLSTIPHDRRGDESLPVWTKTVHTYQDRVLLDGSTPERPRSVFPRRTETVTHFYEGVVNPAGPGTKSMTERFEYDELGNLQHYEELGEPGPADDVLADVEYAELPGYKVGLPLRLLVRNAGGQLLRERTVVYDPATGNLLRLTSTLAGGTSPTSHLTWDSRGNLTSFTDPVGYQITYKYDPQVQTYVTEVTDSFGYRSTATHDFAFGVPLLNTDVNGEKTEYRYDEFGRTTAIFGPKEFGGPVPAFAMNYVLGGRPSGPGSLGQRPFAVTRNKEDLTGSGTLDTVTVVDGLGRVVQVQTEAEVWNGSTKAHGVIVSGRVAYDAPRGGSRPRISRRLWPGSRTASRTPPAGVRRISCSTRSIAPRR